MKEILDLISGAYVRIEDPEKYTIKKHSSTCVTYNYGGGYYGGSTRRFRFSAAKAAGLPTPETPEEDWSQWAE